MMGSAARSFRRTNHIRHRILTKFGLLMETMVPHHVIQFCQNWPPDGRDTDHFRGAEGGVGAVTDGRSAVVLVVGDDEFVNK